VQLLTALEAPPPDLVLKCGPVRLKQDRMPAPFDLKVGEAEPCIVRLLWQYWRVCKTEGQPLVDVLFRPLSADGRAFLEKKSSCSAFNQRVKHWFEAAGLLYKPTPHGGRRGAVQSADRHGVAEEDLGKLARIKTPHVRDWYRDTERHVGGLLPRVKRQRL
jgi:hypothetical protein